MNASKAFEKWLEQFSIPKQEEYTVSMQDMQELFLAGVEAYRNAINFSIDEGDRKDCIVMVADSVVGYTGQVIKESPVVVEEKIKGNHTYRKSSDAVAHPMFDNFCDKCRYEFEEGIVDTTIQPCCDCFYDEKHPKFEPRG